MDEVTYTNRYGVTREITSPFVIALMKVGAVAMMIFAAFCTLLLTMLALAAPFFFMALLIIILPFDLLLKLFKRRGFIQRKQDVIKVKIAAKSFKRQKH
jgi:hypothetical protein